MQIHVYGLLLSVCSMSMAFSGDCDAQLHQDSATGGTSQHCQKKLRVESSPGSFDTQGSEGEGVLSEFVTTRAGVQMPRLIYGTAWKKERTEDLVRRAVAAGFKGIDTAGQPKHYFEPGVGAALKTLFSSGLAREAVFIQTKVNRNYAAELNPDANISTCVEFAIAKSLSNLGIEYVDSLVLHSPYRKHEETMEAWRAMEKAVQKGLVRQLGISNVRSLQELQRVHSEASIKPVVVQQRFYAETNFEHDMRLWCTQNGVHFQSFWTLTANSKQGRSGRDAVVSPIMRQLADKYNVTPQVLFFRYVMALGVVPLTGTCNDDHMKQALEARSVPLEGDDTSRIHDLLFTRSAKREDL